MVKLFQKIGEWDENDARVPNVGDIIFYDWQDSGYGDNKGTPDHVGIVEKVENGLITVIEGNIRDSVNRRSISVNARYIRGYGVPKYAASGDMTIETVAREVISGKWGNGTIRKQRLTAAGYDYAVVQRKVNELLG